MITKAVTNNQIARAKDLYKFGELNGSITKGKSNLYGAVGEIIVFDMFQKNGSNIEFTSTYDYDMIVDGIKIDVKTKRTTVTPKPHYLCSISNFNTKQECDVYIFVRVLDNFGTAFILGGMTKKEFFKKAHFRKKGDHDINDFEFKDDCYNLEIQKLVEFVI